jgi:hypothetical protein
MSEFQPLFYFMRDVAQRKALAYNRGGESRWRRLIVAHVFIGQELLLNLRCSFKILFQPRPFRRSEEVKAVRRQPVGDRGPLWENLAAELSPAIPAKAHRRDRSHAMYAAWSFKVSLYHVLSLSVARNPVLIVRSWEEFVEPATDGLRANPAAAHYSISSLAGPSIW